MRVVLLGAPGAGKGTIAEILVKSYAISQISTGDILRSAVNDSNKVGEIAKGYMKRGELVPDSIIMEIMEKRLQQNDCRKGFILDGFPRTLSQAESLKEMLNRLDQKLDMVVNLEVPEDIIIRRLASRRTCSNLECQAVYNIHTKPSEIEGICDKCGSPTIQRDDETEDAIRQRLITYQEKTSPLIEYYSSYPQFLSVPAIDARVVVDKIVKFFEG